MGPSNCLFRLPHRVHRELPVNQSNSVDDNPVKAQASYSPRIGFTQDAAEKDNSATKPLHDRTRVLFLPVLGREAFRWMVADLKPETSERRSKTSEVQDGHAPERTKYARGRHKTLPGRLPTRRRGTGSVGRFLGFAGHVLPRPCRSQGHKVSPFRLRRRDLRVSGPAVRPVNRSQDLYTSGQSGGSLFQDTGARSRRDLSAGCQLPGHGPLGNAEGRLHSERGKIQLGSVPVSSVSGVFSRLGPPPGVSVRGSDKSVTAAYPPRSVVSGETLEVAVRSPGQYDSTGTRGPESHSSPPVLCAGEVGHVHAGVDPCVPDSGCPGDPLMVAPYSEPHIRGSFLGPGPGDDDRHRRFVLRVGRSPGRPDGFWHLAPGNPSGSRDISIGSNFRRSGSHCSIFCRSWGAQWWRYCRTT